MKHHIILRIVSKILIPIIMLFALYVQFHGDFGPGGGFQAGVIFASALILHVLVFGLENTQKVIKSTTLQIFAALGVLIFAGVGVVTMLLGGEFLNYNYLAKSAVSGQHLGILIIELGVGITVASVILLIFYHFAGLKADD